MNRFQWNVIIIFSNEATSLVARLATWMIFFFSKQKVMKKKQTKDEQQFISLLLELSLMNLTLMTFSFFIIFISFWLVSILRVVIQFFEDWLKKICRTFFCVFFLFLVSIDNRISRKPFLIEWCMHSSSWTLMNK